MSNESQVAAQSRGKAIKRWEVRLRLEFIETRLFWEGKLNRADLVDFFGVSVIQASKDISQYQGAAPGNIIYDKSNKYYLASAQFDPVFISPNAETYLSQLRLAEKNEMLPQLDFFGPLPSINIVPTLFRKVDTQILKTTLACIREKKDAEILYQSMSRPEPLLRWITPHALSFDGQRWHVRAFCHVDSRFKDFLLGRILEVGRTRDGSISPRLDGDWMEIVTIKIGAHPGLSEMQKMVIENDYAMTDGVLCLKIRKASLFYMLKNLKLEKVSSIRSPEDQQIVLL